MKKMFLGVLALAFCLSLLGIAEKAYGATGDIITINTRVKNVNANGVAIGSVNSGFENTHTTWNGYTNGLVSLTRVQNLSTSASWTTRYLSTANGQAQWGYVDKYGVEHYSNVLTVRHGLGTGYIWDCNRYFNNIKFIDQFGRAFVWDAVYYSRKGLVAMVNSERCFGDATNGYYFPVVGGSNNQILYLVSGSQVLTLNVDGIANTCNFYTQTIQVSTAASSATSDGTEAQAATTNNTKAATVDTAKAAVGGLKLGTFKAVGNAVKLGSPDKNLKKAE